MAFTTLPSPDDPYYAVRAYDRAGTEVRSIDGGVGEAISIAAFSRDELWVGASRVTTNGIQTAKIRYRGDPLVEDLALVPTYRGQLVSAGSNGALVRPD